MNEVAATLEPKAWDVPEVKQASQQVAPMRSDPVPDDPILAAILAAARDPHVDIEKFKALKAMYDEERNYRAEVAYRESMTAAQGEMEPVVKDARNTQTKSSYARIEAIAKVITPIYTKHGFSLEFGEGETEKPNHIRVTCTVGHAEGHKVERKLDVPVDATGIQGSRNKTDTHAVASSLTYGRRHLTLMIFNIATEDDDGNASGGRVGYTGALLEPVDLMEVRELLGKTGRTEGQLLGWVNAKYRLTLEKVEDMPAELARPVKAFLLSKVEKPND